MEKEIESDYQAEEHGTEAEETAAEDPPAPDG